MLLLMLLKLQLGTTVCDCVSRRNGSVKC